MRKTKPRSVCLIGNFPPAFTSGQALINESYRRDLTRSGVHLSVIKLRPAIRETSRVPIVNRLPSVLAAAFKLVALASRGMASSVYIGLSGGKGQVYDAAFIAIARMARAKLFLHHDSYAYLKYRRRLTASLVAVAGSQSLHIVNCEDMRQRLQRLYPTARRVVVVSNSTNVDPPMTAPVPRSKLVTIGFISFISRAKGIFEFLDVVDRVCTLRSGLRALVAGPIVEPALQPLLLSRLGSSPWVRYLGPVHGGDKSRFFAETDVLVFPTRYVNEAEPRIISEALAHGVVVVARERGCVAAALEGGGGVSVPDSDDFVSVAERLLMRWSDDSAAFASLSASAVRNFQYSRKQHTVQLDAVLRAMVSDEVTC